MDDLKRWVYTIVLVMVFVTFIDILMPNNNIKKYTKLILGLLVMTIILQPIFYIVNKDFSLTNQSFKYQTDLENMTIKKQSTDYSEKQTQEVTKLYKLNLQNQIGQQIQNEMGDKDVKVSIDIVEDIKSKDYGQIRKIYVSISKLVKPVDKIDKIKINGSEGVQLNREAGNNYELLVKRISAMYGVSEDKIEIVTKS